jgi:bifunctional DNase/RNase
MGDLPELDPDGAEPPEAVRMTIRGLMLDPSSNMPIVILHDPDSEIFLPIWIGVFEANAIALRIEGIETARPMTHDLLSRTLEALETTVEKVTISDLQENTFFATLELRSNGSRVAIDCRPSDAIALALRSDAPIFVLRSVLESAQAVHLAGKAEDDERIRKWLEDASPEDLGEYEM